MQSGEGGADGAGAPPAWSAVLDAVRKRDTARLAALLDADPALARSTEPGHKFSALHWAVCDNVPCPASRAPGVGEPDGRGGRDGMPSPAALLLAVSSAPRPRAARAGVRGRARPPVAFCAR